MTRALLTLLGGVLGAVLFAVAISPAWRIGSGFGFVLLTILAGAVVMAVTARRTALRERATELDAQTRDTTPHAGDHTPERDTADSVTDGQEADRG